jgi:hypothetical protein
MNSRHVRLTLLLLAILLASTAVAFVAARLLALNEGQTAHAASATPAPGAQKGSDDPRLAKSYRFDRGGWIYVHLEGSPHDIGFQHGYLLADEIADAFSAVNLEMTHTTDRDWEFFRRASRQMLWPKIDPEYQAELQGIVDGLQARRVKLDLDDRRDECVHGVARLLRALAE